MSNSASYQVIDLRLLNEFQVSYQTDLKELIDIYITDALKKFDKLENTLDMGNITEFLSTARDLRSRSLDIGAVRFSHSCLGLEVAAQEHRIHVLAPFIEYLQCQFQHIQTALLEIKSQRK